MTNYQMELGFNAAERKNAYQQRRTNRAQWWFQQMRRAVDCALEWQPGPGARPEQAHMKFSPRW